MYTKNKTGLKSKNTKSIIVSIIVFCLWFLMLEIMRAREKKLIVEEYKQKKLRKALDELCRQNYEETEKYTCNNECCACMCIDKNKVIKSEQGN